MDTFEEKWVKVCRSAVLENSGKGYVLNWPVATAEEGIQGGSEIEETAFLIRFQHRVYGYLNQCAHRPLELDWRPGHFFDAEGWYLVCSTHGALYQPQTGECVAGPCKGRFLSTVPVREAEGYV